MSASEPESAPVELMEAEPAEPAPAPAEQVPFADICDLLERLYKKKKDRQEQDRILTTFLNEFRLNAARLPGQKNCSLFPIMRLLLPELDRERGPYQLREAKLGALLARVLALDAEAADARRLRAYRGAGAGAGARAGAGDSDFAGVAYFVLRARLPPAAGALSVRDVNDVLDQIANAQVGAKGPALEAALGRALRQLGAAQAKWFLRALLKDMRVGLRAPRALAALHPDAPEYFHSCANLYKTCAELEAGSARPLELGLALFCPVSPMLAERLDVTRAPRLPPASYCLETKFDGERFQLHMQDGVFEYFSRKGHSYGEKFGRGAGAGLLTPRLAGALAARSLVLDGEMMGWHKQRQAFGSKGMAFDVKKLTERSAFQPCFCAFDVLYCDGRVLAGERGAALRARLAVLDAVVRDVPGALVRSRRRPVTDDADVLEALNRAIEEQEEGVVVKDLDSLYLPSRRNAGWYKVKPDYTEGAMVELDLAVVGADEAADQTHGRARSFHVACADAAGTPPGEMPWRWVSVGRVGTGLSHEQRAQLSAALAARWVPRRAAPPPARLVFNKDQPDFWLLPEHSVILQVRATELVRSASSGTSHTLRFPRVVAVRDDKPVRDAMTLAHFNALVAEAGAVVKLAAGPVGAGAGARVGGGAAPRRKRSARAPAVPAHLRAAPQQDVQVVSGALQGRSLCVVSDEEGCRKPELVRIIEAHGGRHVENIGPDTWCCVVGRRTARAAGVLAARAVDAVGAAWLRALAPAPGPAQPAPRDLLAATPATRLRLCRRYDRFGDAYCEPTDEDQLRRCFDRLDQEPALHLTSAERAALEAELRGAPGRADAPGSPRADWPQ